MSDIKLREATTTINEARLLNEEHQNQMELKREKGQEGQEGQEGGKAIARSLGRLRR